MPFYQNIRLGILLHLLQLSGQHVRVCLVVDVDGHGSGIQVVGDPLRDPLGRISLGLGQGLCGHVGS